MLRRARPTGGGPLLPRRYSTMAEPRRTRLPERGNDRATAGGDAEVNDTPWGMLTRKPAAWSRAYAATTPPPRRGTTTVAGAAARELPTHAPERAIAIAIPSPASRTDFR